MGITVGMFHRCHSRSVLAGATVPVITAATGEDSMGVGMSVLSVAAMSAVLAAVGMSVAVAVGVTTERAWRVG